MKFLAFTDLHQDKKFLSKLVSRAEEKDIDFVVCAGDISIFGKGLSDVLKAFDKVNKKFYFIPGNHEEHITDIDKILAKFSNCLNLHKKSLEIGEYIFCGYGGGGFTQEDAGFRKVSREWYSRYNGRKIVLVTHQPPFGVKVDLLEKRHVGNIDYRRFIERIKPKLVICGHLHETAGQQDQLENTKIVNPGWEGMVVELK